MLLLEWHIGVFYFNIFVQTRDRKRSTESCWQSVFAFVFEVISCAQFVHVCISILLTHLYLQSSCICVSVLLQRIFSEAEDKSLTFDWSLSFRSQRRRTRSVTVMWCWHFQWGKVVKHVCSCLKEGFRFSIPYYKDCVTRDPFTWQKQSREPQGINEATCQADWN